MYAIPTISINTQPLYILSDQLNTDLAYQNRMINTIKTLFFEKWLYHNSIYNRLLKYFYVQNNAVSIIASINDIKNNLDPSYANLAYYLIENHYCNDIDDWIKYYIASNKYSYYNILLNTGGLKDYLCGSIEQAILNNIV